jgi:FkbM family methyltransferase
MADAFQWAAAAMSTNQPPLPVIGLGAVLRRLPAFRGRWRLERWLERRATGKDWRYELETHGIRLELALADEIDRQIFLNGVYERAATAGIESLPLAGAAIVDAGANIGWHTLLFARCASPQGRVHAIEPVPANAVRLQRNLALNPALAAISTHWQTAFSDAPGELEMVVAGATHSGTSHVVPATPVVSTTREEAGEAGRLRVSATTLDVFWRQLGRPMLGAVKLDLEGFEMRALGGARELLAVKPGPVVMVEVIDPYLRSQGGSREKLFADLLALGYHAHDFDLAAGRFVAHDTPHDSPLVFFSRRAL